MRFRVILVLLLDIPILLSVPGCIFGPANVQPLYSVQDISFPGGPVDDISRAGRQIIRAATMLGWIVEETEPGEILAIKRKGQHGATVDIRFDTVKFSVNYRNSTRLDYVAAVEPPPPEDSESPFPNRQAAEPRHTARIHKLYNIWVRELKRAIQREMSAG